MADALMLCHAEDLRRCIVRDGLDATAVRFGLNTTTLLRAAVGLPLHNATRQLIEGKLNNAETKD